MNHETKRHFATEGNFLTHAKDAFCAQYTTALPTKDKANEKLQSRA
jgi:hypothetical protein